MYRIKLLNYPPSKVLNLLVIDQKQAYILGAFDAFST